MSARVGLMVPLLLATAVVGWVWRDAPSPDGAPGPAVAEDADAARGVSLDTLVVDFRDDVSRAELETNAYREDPVSRYSAVDKLFRIRFASAAEAARAAAALRRDPAVQSVDYEVEASIWPGDQGPRGQAEPAAFAECATEGAAVDGAGFPDDPCFRYQWHMRQLGLPAAWKMGQGEGVTVAVIDTGVSRVPDLKQARFVTGYNFVADSANADDDHGHGTHVAGTIAQATNNKLGVGGVAFGATIMPLKVLSASGSGSMAAIAQAIRFAADQGAKVINMSLGGPFPVTTIKHAVDYARTRGVVVVAAAGNDGRGRVSYPARYPGVLAVAATQFDEKPTFYSNWGKEVDLAAPGGNTRVDQNGDGQPDGVLQNTVVPGNVSQTDYLWFMGTSMASPHVAGVAALVMGAGVNKPDAVEAILVSTARKPKGRQEATGRIDDHYGAGIADAGAAVKKARLGRGAASTGLGASLAFLGLGALRRRRALALAGSGLAPSLIFSLLLGAAGLLEGAALVAGPGVWASPLLLSAGLPIAAIALLYGVRRLRPSLAGLAFGWAGALAFAALAAVTDVRWVPDALDRLWLLAHAGLSALLGALALRR